MQVKNNGIKLDMRGRCSAGQKVKFIFIYVII